MRSSPARLLPAACSAQAQAPALVLVLALAACGSAPGQHASTGSAATPAQASPGGTLAPTSCGPPPPRHAWAVEVTRTGRIGWKTPLEARETLPYSGVRPVVAGPVAVFAQDGIVHGIRLADGHPLWSWPGGQSVYGMWLWGGLLAVLTDQVSNHARLTGLDAATGAIRWQRRIAASPALTAVGDLVIYGLNGQLTGYEARTGRPRWAIAPGVSQDPAFQLAGGLLLVTSNIAGPSIPNTVTAVVPATGRVAWRFDPPTPSADPGAQASVLSAGPGGLAVATYDPRRLYLLDLRTGRPRWHADTFVVQGSLPLVTGASVILTEGQDHVAVVARDAVNGRVRWRAALPGASAGYQPVLAAGPLAILQGEPPAPGEAGSLLAFQAAGGRLAWRAAMPAFVQAPPVLVAGGILVQPADLGYACAVAG